MKERPILMTPENAQKVFHGLKTQTRRIIKPQPANTAMIPPAWSEVMQQRKDRDIYGTDGLTLGNVPMADGTWGEMRCPFGTVGGQLWIREACWIWGIWVKEEDGRHFHEHYSRQVTFDTVDVSLVGKKGDIEPLWVRRPAIFMPRWACRTVLEIIEVRVEQLGSISESDAKAEGVGSVSQFIELWNSINKTWESDLWVWVLEFRKVSS